MVPGLALGDLGHTSKGDNNFIIIYTHAGRVLKLADREAIMRLPIYTTFSTHVQREDYAAARATIDGPTLDDRMLSRAMNSFNPATLVPPAVDSVRCHQRTRAYRSPSSKVSGLQFLA